MMMLSMNDWWLVGLKMSYFSNLSLFTSCFLFANDTTADDEPASRSRSSRLSNKIGPRPALSRRLVVVWYFF
jgi:hypothetical protein